MNLSVAAFGNLSDEQKEMIHRSIQIENERNELYVEQQDICRKLGYQGINLWDEMRYAKSLAEH